MQPRIEIVNANASGNPGMRMVFPLRDGDDGVIDTIECMRSLAIFASERSPYVAKFAAGASSPARLIYDVYTMLQASIRRVDDPPGVELLEHPDIHLSRFARLEKSPGDCDDHAIIGASILDRAGIPAAFCVANIEGQGKPFTHVFYAAKLGGQWQPIDSQERIPPGYFASAMRRFGLIPLR